MKRTETKTHSLIHKLNRDYLALSLVPLITFLICTIAGAFTAQKYIAELIDGSMRQLETEIKTQTVKDGEKFIQSHAREVALQIESIIGSHPGVTIEQLQQSPVLRHISQQRVGRTGYTCLYEAGTGIMRIHPNSEMIDRSLVFLSEKLPSFWKIFESSLTGVEVSGYYDWLEEDGRITQKYMAMTPVGGLLDGRTLWSKCPGIRTKNRFFRALRRNGTSTRRSAKFSRKWSTAAGTARCANSRCAAATGGSSGSKTRESPCTTAKAAPCIMRAF
jgi:uncharacterized protein YneF (UPF0154 family)